MTTKNNVRKIGSKASGWHKLGARARERMRAEQGRVALGQLGQENERIAGHLNAVTNAINTQAAFISDQREVLDMVTYRLEFLGSFVTNKLTVKETHEFLALQEAHVAQRVEETRIRRDRETRARIRGTAWEALTGYLSTVKDEAPEQIKADLDGKYTTDEVVEPLARITAWLNENQAEVLRGAPMPVHRWMAAERPEAWAKFTATGEAQTPETEPEPEPEPPKAVG